MDKTLVLDAGNIVERDEHSEPGSSGSARNRSKTAIPDSGTGETILKTRSNRV